VLGYILGVFSQKSSGHPDAPITFGGFQNGDLKKPTFARAKKIAQRHRRNLLRANKPRSWFCALATSQKRSIAAGSRCCKHFDYSPPSRRRSCGERIDDPFFKNPFFSFISPLWFYGLLHWETFDTLCDQLRLGRFERKSFPPKVDKGSIKVFF
jgi:hypothetical protein